jgi:predicted ABC-class ATPase
MDAADLEKKLEQIDGRGYKAYRQLRGSYAFPRFTLFIDYVQGDPYAAPSRLRARAPQAEAGFPAEMYGSRVRRTALEDYLARSFSRAITKHVKGGRGSGKSGLVSVDAGGQQVIERTAAVVTGDYVEVRFAAGLPAAGRRCLGKEAAAMFLEEVPALVDAALFIDALDRRQLLAHIDAAEDQEWLRRQLPDRGLVAFVADGSLLPRASGVSDLPLREGEVIPFRSPLELRVEFSLPNRGRVSGMGIPEGITLVVGGGFHGKSTLLNALEQGVYNHLPADGRELVVTRGDAVKVRAEDGRRVEKVDISPFIDNLPLGRDTVAFCTDNASGSTSQAANIVEAMEVGCRLLLIDEDTSATNFMIRDELMQQLIAREREPITPLIDQARNLARDHGVSIILVMGGSGDYFEVADTVIAMDGYRPEVVTGRAREIMAARKDRRTAEGGDSFGELVPRAPRPEGIDPRRGRKEKVAARGLSSLEFGRQSIDLSQVEQLVEVSQTRAIGEMIRHALRRGYIDGSRSLRDVIDTILADIADHGLDIISPYLNAAVAAPAAERPHPGDFALPRRHEAAAALNRLRSLSVMQLRP